MTHALLDSKKIEYGRVLDGWTILDRRVFLNSADKHVYYAVKCNTCGWQTIYRGSFLVKGKTPKCKVCNFKEKQPEPGTKFGKLHVARVVQQATNQRKTIFECLCDCGNVCNVSYENLVNGHTKSCGCGKSKPGKENPNYKHGLRKDPLYTHYRAMKERCSNQNYHHYQRYGGRGVCVCEEWLNDFVAFREWALHNGYKKGLSLDRIDNDGNYEPNNCRWVDQKTQVRNSTKTIKDKTKTPLVVYLEKQDKKHLHDYALRLWRTIVRARAGGICELCGAEGTDAHHWYFTKAQGGLVSIMPLNGVFLCRKCHQLAHAKVAETKERIKKLRNFNNLAEDALIKARQQNATAKDYYSSIIKMRSKYKQYI